MITALLVLVALISVAAFVIRNAIELVALYGNRGLHRPDGVPAPRIDWRPAAVLFVVALVALVRS